MLPFVCASEISNSNDFPGSRSIASYSWQRVRWALSSTLLYRDTFLLPGLPNPNPQHRSTRSRPDSVPRACEYPSARAGRVAGVALLCRPSQSRPPSNRQVPSTGRGSAPLSRLIRRPNAVPRCSGRMYIEIPSEIVIGAAAWRGLGLDCSVSSARVEKHCIKLIERSVLIVSNAKLFPNPYASSCINLLRQRRCVKMIPTVWTTVVIQT